MKLAKSPVKYLNKERYNRVSTTCSSHQQNMAFWRKIKKELAMRIVTPSLAQRCRKCGEAFPRLTGVGELNN